MGQYPITAGVFGKALAIPGTGNGGTITTPSAWLFENQSGTLGTNYNSSQVYVGATGTVTAILSGTVGAQDTATGLDLTSGGLAYVTGTALVTSATSLVPRSPASQPSGLTVDITADSLATVGAAGLNYTNGAFTVAGGSGLTGTIGVNAGTGAIETVIITNVGTAVASDNFAPLGRGGDGNGQIVLQGNGVVTAVAINAAGTNYSVGDICKVTQAGSNGSCTFVITSVNSLLPVVGDAITFKDVQVGSVLPVAIDYVVTCPANSVALK